MRDGTPVSHEHDTSAAAATNDAGRLTVLVVEDDPAVAAMVVADVESLGWRAIAADTVSEARACAARETIDLVYLDRMLADGEDGIELLHWFRALEAELPGVLIASRLSATTEHVRGLDSGADDYVDKPFESIELKSRLRALARRRGGRHAPLSVLLWDGLELRTLNRIALWHGQPIELRAQSFDMLLVLVEHRGEWISREVLWRRLWPAQANVEPRRYLINVATSRLRGSLASVGCDWRVESSDTLGYRLVPPV